MTPLVALLLLITPEPPREVGEPQRNAREIMRAVLAEEARLHRGSDEGPAPCVKMIVDGVSLNGRRAMLANQEAERSRPAGPSPPRAGEPTPITPELHFAPLEFDWVRPFHTPDGYFGEGDVRLPRAEDRAITRAAGGIIRNAEQGKLLGKIDPAWLQKPLSFCEGDPSEPYLSFSSPAVSGNFAFVTADFQCVICGQGVILALKRMRHRWIVVAVDQQWVS
jgi:hypothetical protein